jgi:RNA polymerase sigma-70 factor (ECF subfamily)
MAIAEVNFEGLFKTHHKRLCNLAYTVVRDKDSAKDIVQDVFFKLWKNREKVQWSDSIEGYLVRATSHTALNHLRDNKRSVRLDQLELINLLASTADGTEIGYTEFELNVRRAIDRLPPKCKAIYRLSRDEEMKYTQIADALEISIKTVENQMSIALQKLREDLKPYLIPTPILIPLLMGLVGYILF